MWIRAVLSPQVKSSVRNMKLRRFLRATAIMAMAVGAAQRAPAGVVLATSASALESNDSVDWGQLGPDSTSLQSSIPVTSAGGLGVRVTTTDPSGLVRVDEGLSWIGNFTVGDHLISNNQFAFSPLTIHFASPISGAGAQIQLDSSEPFTATIEAFAGTTSLGKFTEDGNSTSPEDGSAIFIGVLDSVPAITSLVFGIDNPPPFEGDFAIDSLLINTPVSVPEPTSCVLAMFGIAVGLGIWWRARERALFARR
jgi:PEP-CTERM motif